VCEAYLAKISTFASPRANYPTTHCFMTRCRQFAAYGLRVDTGDEFTKTRMRASRPVTVHQRFWAVLDNSPPVSVLRLGPQEALARALA
jgi:hypothetical protein